MRFLHAFALPACLLLTLGCDRPGAQGDARSRLPAPIDGKFHRDEGGRLFVQTRGVGADLKPGPVFYRQVPPIDVASYRFLGWYSLDRRRVYVEQETSDGLSIHVLEGADPATFEVFGYRWGKDVQRVWHNGVALENLVPAELVVIPGQDPIFFDFVRDARRVFVGHREIVEADASSFSCLPDPRVPDRLIAADRSFVWNLDAWSAETGFGRTPR